MCCLYNYISYPILFGFSALETIWYVKKLNDGSYALLNLLESLCVDVYTQLDGYIICFQSIDSVFLNEKIWDLPSFFLTVTIWVWE